MDPLPDDTQRNDRSQVRQGLKNDRQAQDVNPIINIVRKFLKSFLWSDRQSQEVKLQWREEDVLTASGRSYTIVCNLATGGFGNTYKAKSNQTGECVVLKMPTPKLWKDLKADQCRRIFEEEGDRLAGFQYSGNLNLVKYITRFQLDSGVPVLVMEFVEGENLHDRIRETGLLSESKALEYIRQIAEGVKALHQAKPPLFHRDIKPANIILRQTNAKEIPVLVDFGISREAGSQDTNSGTEGMFAPPEQTDRFNPARPCYSHDVYALAVLLYWLVRGTDPYSEPPPPEESLSQQTYKAIVFVTKLNKENRMVNRSTVDQFLWLLLSPENSTVLPSPRPLVVEPTEPTQTIAPAPSPITLPSVPEITDLSHPLPVVKERSLLNGWLWLSLITIVCAAAGAIVWFILFRDVPPIIVTPPTTTSRSTTPGLPPAQETPTPLKQETQTVMGFENIPIQIPRNPNRWTVEIPELKPEFDKRTIVQYQLEEAIVTIKQYPKLEDWSADKPEGGHWDCENCKEIPKFEDWNFAGRSAFQVTYTRSGKLGRLIIVPVETELYFLFYEAPKEAFDRHSEEASALLQSIQFSSTTTTP